MRNNQEFNLSEKRKALNKLVKLGLLEKKKIKGEWYYKDSNKVRIMLKKGLNRKEIRRMIRAEIAHLVSQWAHALEEKTEKDFKEKFIN